MKVKKQISSPTGIIFKDLSAHSGPLWHFLVEKRRRGPSALASAPLGGTRAVKMFCPRSEFPMRLQDSPVGGAPGPASRSVPSSSTGNGTETQEGWAP